MSAIHGTTDALVAALRPLRFAAPVAFVYQPLEYARAGWDAYVERWGRGRKEVLFVGMNPGPFGMAQTGVPFGAVSIVRDWLGLDGLEIGKPPREHPKRPVTGLACPREEASGARLWGWARERFGDPDRFFDRFFVANYCPLLFLEKGGRNLTPDQLPVAERERLFPPCDRALHELVTTLEPGLVVGVGAFAEARARAALADLDIRIGRVLHPSPASPTANRGWALAAERQLAALGVAL